MPPDNVKENGGQPPVKSVLLVVGPLDIRSVSFSAINLARGLTKLGVKVLFFCGKGPLTSELENLGVEWAELESIDSTFPDFLDASKATARTREAGVELVHALSPGELKLATRIGKNLGVPVIATFHDYFDRERAVSIKPKHVRSVIAVSEAVREDIVNHAKISKDLVRVIPDGVDLEQTGPIPVKLNKEDRIRAVGTIGRLVESQGQGYFLEAAALILERGFEVNFTLVGEGEDRDALKRMAKEIGIDEQVLFLEPRKSNAGIFRALDVFVLPSLREGLGQLALEAMAHGVPVVATGAGGLYIVVKDEQTGLIVPQKDSYALANAIIRILDDEDFAASLAVRARKSVEKNFSMEKVTKEILDLYEATISEE